MNKQLSYVLYVVLGIVTAALLIMTIVASAGGKAWGGMMTIFVLSLLALAIAISLVAFNPRKNVYSIGFYLLHLGIVLFLLGCLIYTVSGYSVVVAVPNGGSITNTVEYQIIQKGGTANDIAALKGYYNQIPGPEDAPEELGFNMRITDFKTEYYDKEQKNVKHYEATLEFLYKDGSVETKKLTVNHTLHVKGWKLYLMDVGVDEVYGYQKVQILFKRDPAEMLSTLGIILTVIGTFMMCLIKPRTKDPEVKGKKKPALATAGNSTKKGGGRK